jgi:hypothetical protein
VVKKILAYILLLIMIIQVLPQSLFELETKAVVMVDKEMESKDNLKEKESKENKIAALYSCDFMSIADDPAHVLHYHAHLILSLEKEVATPPPNFC